MEVGKTVPDNFSFFNGPLVLCPRLGAGGEGSFKWAPESVEWASS